MGKNIVMCLDGTANEYGNRNTNILKLYSAVQLEDPTSQIAYYDPGVGTMADPRVWGRVRRWLSRIGGLAFGWGLLRNVDEAYRFLMNAYVEGDRVFIFGFSRGAYTARALVGLIHKCGLLAPGNDQLIPYAVKLFRRTHNRDVAAGFRSCLARPCRVHFLGLFDTVRSVNFDSLPYTTNNPSVAHVRHAIALDERRAKYRQNLWGPAVRRQTVKQVWFPGVHSDVGGGYPEPESGLSKIPLRWMLQEAEAQGLVVDKKLEATILPSPSHADDPTSTASRRVFAPVNPLAQLHRSLKGWWWLVEYLPLTYWSRQPGPKRKYRRRIRINRGRARFVPNGASIHESVMSRMRDDHTYRPRFPAEFRVVHDPPAPGAVRRTSVRSAEIRR